MSPDLRTGLRALAEALPTGTAVPVPRELLLELLDGAPTPAPASNGAGAPAEHMLTAEEVAARLSTTERWVYDHADQLGGKRLSKRCLRFPESSIRRRVERR